MKKNKLLLLALTPLVLAGCGEDAGFNPIAEPTVEKTLTAKEAAPVIKDAAKALGETKGLGFKAEGYAKASLTIKTQAAEGMSGYGESYTSTFDLSGLEANFASRFDEGILQAGFAASADLKGKLNADVNLFTPDSEKSTEEAIVTKDVHENVNSEVSATVSYEENTIYADLTGLQPLGNLATDLLGFAAGAGIEIDTSDIFSKVKVAMEPGLITFLLPSLPNVIGSLLDGVANGLADGTTVPGESVAFKKYTDGTYGFTAGFTASEIMETVSTFGVLPEVEGMDKITGTLNTVIVFSEKGLVSIGLKENFATAEFASTNIELPEEFPNPVKSVSLTSDAGVKLTFTTGDDVTVNKVTDKSAYKDITPAPEEE